MFGEPSSSREIQIFWSLVHSLSDDNPDTASRAVGSWLRRLIAQAMIVAEPGQRTEDSEGPTEVKGQPSPRAKFAQEALGHSDEGSSAILDLAKRSSTIFVLEALPSVIKLVRMLAVPARDRLDRDIVWGLRTLGHVHRIGDAILEGLAIALASIASTDPAVADEVIKPIESTTSDTLSLLVLRCWTGNPKRYANRIMDFIADDPRRSRVGYGVWGGGEDPGQMHSARALSAAAEWCDPDRLVRIQEALRSFVPEHERSHPRSRGRAQLTLLRTIPLEKLGAESKRFLAELERKFEDLPQAPSTPVQSYSVPSPIPDDAAKRMSDDQWLRALRKYAEMTDTEWKGEIRGGRQELARTLTQATASQPGRLLRLALRLEANDPAIYYDAILEGLVQAIHHDQRKEELPAVSELTELLLKVHALPGKPCGRGISAVIDTRCALDWPAAILDVVSWYAVHDPSPRREDWQPDSGESYCEGDPLTAGINSVRGSVAETLAKLIQCDSGRFTDLRSAIDSTMNDTSLAVRSCAAAALIPSLSIAPEQTWTWFEKSILPQTPLLTTHHVARFVDFAVSYSYEKVRNLLVNWLYSEDRDLATRTAVVLCLAGLRGHAPAEDVALVTGGAEDLRASAAKVYATNVDVPEVADRCRAGVIELMRDGSEAVRERAAAAFEKLSIIDTPGQQLLLQALIRAEPTQEQLRTAIRALEDSPVALPELTCELVEMAVAVFGSSACDLSNRDYLVGVDISKLVLRTYTQSTEPAIRGRCLDLIDTMELASFGGLREEMSNLERS